MSVLRRWSLLLAVTVALAGLSSCDRGSSNYQHIKTRPPDQWNSYAATLPVDRRLTLHKEIMERSGHNPLNTISESFGADPQETYANIVKRLKAGDRSRFYLPVIYAINRSPNFKICDQSDRRVVQRFLWDHATDAVKREHRSDFYRC